MLPSRIVSRGRAAGPLLALAVALTSACGGSDSGLETDSACAPPCLTSATNPSGSGNPTGADPTDSGGEPSACAACGEAQVCISGECTDVPTMCPCPVETYCDLATNSCVIGCTRDEECDKGRICDPIQRECVPGCREDAHCGAGEICEGLSCIEGCREDADCGPMQLCDGITCRLGCHNDGECPQGQVCDDTVCREGCTADADCSKPGDICDLAKKTCRAGCHANSECPLEQICDQQALACVPGCDTHAKCSAGKVCNAGQCTAGCLDDSGCAKGQLCKGNQCVPGCHTHADCALAQYCFEEKCIPGCGPTGGHWYDADEERCQIGEACVPDCNQNTGICSSYTCTAKCADYECNRDAENNYVCFGQYLENLYCMELCKLDSQCEGGKLCVHNKDTDFDGQLDSGGVCRKPCSSDVDCQDQYVKDQPLYDCKCEFAGPLKGKCSYFIDNETVQCGDLEADPP